MSLTFSSDVALQQTKNKEDLKIKILGKILASELQITKEALTLLLEKEGALEICGQLIENLKQKNEFLIKPTHIAHTQQTEQQLQLASSKPQIEIITNFINAPPVEGIASMSKYFTARLTQYKKYLHHRLQNPQSIANIKRINNEKVSIIGIVFDKTKTPNGTIILLLEDLTGATKVIINKQELLNQAEDILFDEVIGVSGSATKGVIFADEITTPNIPVNKEEKKTKNLMYAGFLSDMHIGSKKFLEDKFESLISFLTGKSRNTVFLEDYSEILDNLKYIFVAGDLVDGIGVYPNQEKELAITNIQTQYSKTAKFFARLPENITIVICPGNHDFVRQAQPQPPIEKEVAPELYELPNLTMVSSPSIVKIPTPENDGIKVLLYHGTSIDSIVPASANLKDGYKHPEKAMLVLLKKRHLSPPYDSGIVPALYDNADPLAIPEDIDIIHTGHTHSNGLLNYRGVSLINSGTWQDTTDFQRLLGHEPTPGQFPIMNLKTRQTKIFAF